MITAKTNRKRPSPTPQQRKERAQLLESLIYEMWDGKPVYYAGYQDVIAQRKTKEEIMSSSLLQSRLASKLSVKLSNQLVGSGYEVLINELGVQFKKGDWRACDLAIFETAILEQQDLTKYAWIPPKIAIEIDTKADMTRFEIEMDYYQQKTTQLLDFGVEKVIWIFTKSEKIWVAEIDKDWLIKSWTQPIEVLPGCGFVISELV
jgi:hypothetical protein